MKEQVAGVQQHLQQARRLAATGQLREALAEARRAVDAAEAIPGEEPLGFEARGAALAELGLLLQRAGDGRGALDAYLRAESAMRRLPFAEGKPHYKLLVATTVINLAGLYTKERRLDEAHAKIADAIALVEGAAEVGPAAQVLLVGALQNRAAIEVEERRPDAAEATLRTALETGERLIESAPQLLPQLVEVAGRLAVVLKGAARATEAVAIAEKSARWAEAAYEAGSQLGMPLYVTTQLQLVDLNFAARRYAQAEDHLWKAVEVAPGPQTLLVGTGFYCSLLRQEDETLASGDLPRDEVVDALDELMHRIRAANPPEELLELVEARRAVLVDREPETAQKILERYTENGSPVIRELANALKSDLDWYATRVVS